MIGFAKQPTILRIINTKQMEQKLSQMEFWNLPKVDKENYDHLLSKILFRHFLHNLRRITAKSVIPVW